MSIGYVKHISKIGERWALAGSYHNNDPRQSDWQVHRHGTGGFHYLPRCEYVLFDLPIPTGWKDVGATITHLGERQLLLGGGERIRLPDGYRVVRIQYADSGPYTFRIEQFC